MKRHRKRRTAIAVAMLIGVPWASGSAHARRPKETPPASKTGSDDTSKDRPETRPQVGLPYAFTRRGVDIRVNYVEFVKGQPEVNVSFQEARKEEVDLIVATLIQVQTSSGQTLTYTGYVRSGQAKSEPEIHLTPGEQGSLSLIYQMPSEWAGSEHQLELHFPTGKWWKSNSSKP